MFSDRPTGCQFVGTAFATALLHIIIPGSVSTLRAEAETAAAPNPAQTQPIRPMTGMPNMGRNRVTYNNVKEENPSGGKKMVAVIHILNMPGRSFDMGRGGLVPDRTYR